ncbi:MAG: peptidase M28, partial [Acidobacteriota bacterium]|nr:peptidase M28 [Acidobacteriota bacterium]
MLKSIGLMVIVGATAGAQDGGISAHRIREDTRALSADRMEGRGTGQRGGDLATDYIAHQLALAGAKPAGENGTYFQKVPLAGVETQPESVLSAAVWGKGTEFKWGDEFVGVNMGQRANQRFEGDVIFVGHGITAPEYRWDDFKGVDVTNKILLLFTSEPPSTDPKFFDGRALTYYGRWTYKYEEALRRGARACIIIHTTETASYGWDVVRSSWGRENPYVKLPEGGKALAFAGWLSRGAAGRLLALSNHTVEELLQASERADFRPIDLG